VPKDKKDKKDKKQKKGKKKDGASKAVTTLQQLTQNPLVADVVAAALIGMASALKDSEKARRLASDAGDQLEKVSKAGAKQGNAMWDLALDIGRRTLETLASEESERVKAGKSR
jgi:hypothetical protein